MASGLRIATDGSLGSGGGGVSLVSPRGMVLTPRVSAGAGGEGGGGGGVSGAGGGGSGGGRLWSHGDDALASGMSLFHLLRSATRPDEAVIRLTAALEQAANGTDAHVVGTGEQAEILLFMAHSVASARAPATVGLALSKLASIFRVDSNRLRALIVHALPLAAPHVVKLAAPGRVVDPVLFVTVSNDPLARALALQALALLAPVVADRVDVRHAVLAGLVSPAHREAAAAGAAAKAIAPHSPHFAAALLAHAAEQMAPGTVCSTDTLLRVLDLLPAINAGDASLFDKVAGLALGVLDSAPAPPVMVPAVAVLAELATSSAAAAAALVGDSHFHASLSGALAELVENSPAKAVRLAAVAAARRMASRPLLAAHHIDAGRVISWLDAPELAPGAAALLRAVVRQPAQLAHPPAQLLAALLQRFTESKATPLLAPLLVDLACREDHSAAPELYTAVEDAVLAAVLGETDDAPEIYACLARLATSRDAPHTFVAAAVEAAARKVEAAVVGRKSEQLTSPLRALTAMLKSGAAEAAAVSAMVDSLRAVADAIRGWIEAESAGEAEWTKPGDMVRCVALCFCSSPGEERVLSALESSPDAFEEKWMPLLLSSEACGSGWALYQLGERAARGGHFESAVTLWACVASGVASPWSYWLDAAVRMVSGAEALANGSKAASAGANSAVVARLGEAEAALAAARLAVCALQTAHGERGIGVFQGAWLSAVSDMCAGLSGVAQVGAGLQSAPALFRARLAASVGVGAVRLAELSDAALDMRQGDVAAMEAVRCGAAQVEAALTAPRLDGDELARAMAQCLASLAVVPSRVFVLSAPPAPSLFISEASRGDDGVAVPCPLDR
ncbi:uncharacterized protein AMSG_10427 [Thecamonas trahens ATCC 50062]|uniref:Integrator complex subunit 7 N-terminal domain-containing protein n=1 Tax=Thecamonas trahens ATCC 50062 TaxID=461836 RepID=A0A0L0DT22_THETB|nr:hypothetical protein AMSG_10427 [Thecamonas trahens ATCC 50062]KNC54573.1 hypothetical protein AMSG_10427 [Thecamonas trahens ATCC 50062]|eukprot:XP_013753586.1 hypothetical protein AMSG_10427 [Thecamonas trahens ATCC 50062]